MDRRTCGQGLAEHSALPALLAELMAALGRNLEAHVPALDAADPNAQGERFAYDELASELRRIADSLAVTARTMAAYRDLPMGRHDARTMARREVLDALASFVQLERSLLDHLQAALPRDEAMLAAARAQH